LRCREINTEQKGEALRDAIEENRVEWEILKYA